MLRVFDHNEKSELKHKAMRKFQTTTTEEHSIKITSILRNCQCHERHGKAKETTETGELHAMWAPRLDPQHKKHIGGKTDEI